MNVLPMVVHMILRDEIRDKLYAEFTVTMQQAYVIWFESLLMFTFNER